jgi:hypothetical protein
MKMDTNYTEQQIVKAREPELAAVTARRAYVHALREAEGFGDKFGLSVADMPMVIQAASNHNDVRSAIVLHWADTLTGEYHGMRDGKRSYEVWHSMGPLTRANELGALFSQRGSDGFIPIPAGAWAAAVDESSSTRLSLSEVKRGEAPKPGSKYSIFTYLDEDRPNILTGSLTHDEFMHADNVLMLAGSLEGRNALAEIVFSHRLVDNKCVGNAWVKTYCLGGCGPTTQAQGRLIRLFSGGLGAHNNEKGTFVALPPFVGLETTRPLEKRL